jgi:hypothetical protein
MEKIVKSPEEFEAAEKALYARTRDDLKCIADCKMKNIVHKVRSKGQAGRTDSGSGTKLLSVECAKCKKSFRFRDALSHLADDGKYEDEFVEYMQMYNNVKKPARETVDIDAMQKQGGVGESKLNQVEDEEARQMEDKENDNEQDEEGTNIGVKKSAGTKPKSITFDKLNKMGADELIKLLQDRVPEAMKRLQDKLLDDMLESKRFQEKLGDMVDKKMEMLGMKKVGVGSSGDQGDGKAEWPKPSFAQAAKAAPPRKDPSMSNEKQDKKWVRVYDLGFGQPRVLPRVEKVHYKVSIPSKMTPTRKDRYVAIYNVLRHYGVRHLVRELSLIGNSAVELFVFDKDVEELKEKMGAKGAVSLPDPSGSTTEEGKLDEHAQIEKTVNRLALLLFRNKSTVFQEAILRGHKQEVCDAAMKQYEERKNEIDVGLEKLKL